MEDITLQGTLNPKKDQDTESARRRRENLRKGIISLSGRGFDDSIIRQKAYEKGGFDPEEIDSVLSEYKQLRDSNFSAPVSQTSQLTQGDIDAVAKQRLGTGDLLKQYYLARDVIDGLKQYRDLYEQVSSDNTLPTEFSGKDAAVLRTKHKALMFSIAQAVGTGALQEADRKLVEELLPDVASLNPLGQMLRGGREGNIAAFNDVIEQTKNRVSRLSGVDRVLYDKEEFDQKKREETETGAVSRTNENNAPEENINLIDPDTGEIKSSGFFDQSEKDIINKLGGAGETLGKIFGGNIIGEAIGNFIGGQLAKHGEAGQTLQDTFQKYVEMKQQGKISEKQFDTLVANIDDTARNAFGYNGPSFKQIAADIVKSGLSVFGGPALQGATKLGTLGRFAVMGFSQGALEETASDKEATVLSTLASGVGGAAGSVVLLGAGSSLGKTFNILTGKNAQKKFASNVARSLGMTGKMTAVSAGNTIPKAISGYSAILEEAKDTTVKDMDGVEKVFAPKDATFGETIQALVNAKNNVYAKYTNLAQQAGDAGASVSSQDINNIISEIKKMSKNSTGATKSKVNSVIRDIVDNFGEEGILKEKNNFKDIQKFIEALNVDVNPLSDKAGAQVSANASKLFRDILDDKIIASTGQEYQALRNKYANIKSVEDALVNQFKKAARGTGTGVADWVSGIGGADAVAGILTGNPEQIVKGVGLGVISRIVKRFRDPEVRLRKVFRVIEKQAAKDGGYQKIGQNITKAIMPSKFGVVGKTIQKIDEKITGVRPGMTIKDVNIGKPGFSLHPEDKKTLINFIDAVRLGKDMPEPAWKGAERLLEKAGIGLNQSLKKLASEAENIVSGKKKLITVLPGTTT